MQQRESSDTEPPTEQFSYRFRKWLLQRLTARRGSDQHRLLAERDWDVLVVLDACRLDAARASFDWPVDGVTSPATCTPDWLERIADDGLFEGATVLTANPQYEKFDFGARTVENFWRTHWDETLQTVRPEPVLERAAEAIAGRDEPIVVHLQQPHWPYVAKIGDGWQLAYDDIGPWSSSDGDITALQVAMARGKVDPPMARRAYRASVRSVWEALVPYVAEWSSTDTSVVVTADHGETFGRIRELTMYEHPCKCHIAPLTDVPWIEFGPAEAAAVPDEGGESVRDRLNALGYVE